jgi:hypothetical protein
MPAVRLRHRVSLVDLVHAHAALHPRRTAVVVARNALDLLLGHFAHRVGNSSRVIYHYLRLVDYLLVLLKIFSRMKYNVM